MKNVSKYLISFWKFVHKWNEKGPIYREIEETFYEEEKCGLKEMRYLEIMEPYQAVQKNSPIKEMTKVT